STKKGLPMLKTLLAALLLSVSTGLLAQTASDAPKPRGERRFDCSKAKDPKACEERLAKAKAAHQKARQACEGKTGAEGRDCKRRFLFFCTLRVPELAPRKTVLELSLHNQRTIASG